MAVRVGINGFGRIGRLVLRAAMEAWPDTDFIQVYGLTETLAPTLCDPVYESRHPDTVGRPTLWSEVRLVDERMTTVSAHQALHAAGRKSKRHRSVIDQAAAVIILQSALDAERATGERAGELVEAETVHDTHE